MTLTAPTGISLRPYLSSDLPRIAAICRDAIEMLAADDYDPEQRTAWAASFDDEARLGARLEQAVTLLAQAGDSIVGFIALKDNEVIELIYVVPEFARKGVATFLCRAIELLAQGRKSAKLVVRASDTAQPLFETLGFTPVQRNTVSLGGQWLTNTSMEKQLQPQMEGGAQ